MNPLINWRIIVGVMQVFLRLVDQYGMYGLTTKPMLCYIHLGHFYHCTDYIIQFVYIFMILDMA